MFTGIIECIGQVIEARSNGTNRTFKVKSPISKDLKIDQSVAHNGVCLTVTAYSASEGWHEVTAIAETLSKTTLGTWQAGTNVNLERCLVAGGRLDGHFVQGHVDAKGVVKHVVPQEGSWLITIGFDTSFAPLLVEKGSICLDGISLTVFNVGLDQCAVAIIPYTWENTNISDWPLTGQVNIEFDILGKYLNRWQTLNAAS